MSKPYIIGFRPDALWSLQRLDRPVAERILGKILWFARFVDAIQHEALTGSWKGYYRYRIGENVRESRVD